MNRSDLMDRREFFKSIPKFLAISIQSFTIRYGTQEEYRGCLLKENIQEDGKAKVAHLINENCIAWGGGSCQACYLSCPLRDRAIRMVDQKPVIDPLICDGCEKCITACQTINDLQAVKLVTAQTGQ